MAAAFLGFAAATWRVSQVAAPILTRTTIGPLVGMVEALDEREVGARLVIRVESFAGLAPEALGAVYRNRSQFRGVATATAGRGARNSRSRGEAERRQTIAERKRAEALAGDRPTKPGSEGDA